MREVILRNPEGVAQGIDYAILLSASRGRPASRRATGSLYPGLAMEDQDFRSPKKKKRCARKLESRFPTMSEEEIAEISKVFVPSNTAKNTQWAVSCFTEWRSARNSARGAKRLCPVDLLENPVVTGHITCYFSHPQSLLPATFHTCLCYSTNTPQQFSIVVRPSQASPARARRGFTLHSAIRFQSLARRAQYRIFLFRERSAILKSSACLPVFVRSRRSRSYSS